MFYHLWLDYYRSFLLEYKDKVNISNHQIFFLTDFIIISIDVILIIPQRANDIISSTKIRLIFLTTKFFSFLKKSQSSNKLGRSVNWVLLMLDWEYLISIGDNSSRLCWLASLPFGYCTQTLQHKAYFATHSTSYRSNWYMLSWTDL